MSFRAWPLLLAVPAAAVLMSRRVTRPLSLSERSRLAGKTFVITGASSGLGRGVALELGRSGARVVLAARRAEALESLVSQIEGEGGQAVMVPTDVTDTTQMQHLLETAVGAFGAIDGWINNAGVAVIGRFDEIPLEDQHRLLDTNLKAMVTGSYLAMRQFEAQGYGNLINVGSVDSEVPHAYQAAYSASKAGVSMLGRVLNEELRLRRQRLIQVSTVLPWALDTPLWDHVGNYTGHQTRIPTMDPAAKAVVAVVRAYLQPQQEITVGYKAKLAYWSHRLTPGLNERLSGLILEKAEIEMHPAATPTSGTLHRPVEQGQGVDGGIRERMKREG
ncbi:SDR family NAD(P)-dependent oxidoreductase [Pseudomonas massiliensis]|uniref:SDR family NAD(P)-dependent oxidoreductase n=1 Tax=Pseudomonas massiliensis TaxID=522492 RepID=UPI0005915FAF|nr:SDR family NAD(P)-dependent oxidoreductase [Pseudomonas massiliensis]